MRTKHYLRQIYYAFGLHAVKTWYLHRGIKDTDLIIGCYQRSGSTWLQNMLYEILTGEIPDHDQMRTVMPLIGNQQKSTPCLTGDAGRVIKTHFSFKKYYKNKKAIYLVRDPRRVAISEFKYTQLYGARYKAFDYFIDSFVSSRGYGKTTWKDHVVSWRKAREKALADILFVKYEDMRLDTLGTLQQVTGFLKLDRSDDELQRIIEDNNLKNMKNREDTSQRKEMYKREDLRVVNEGKVGEWKSELSAEQNNKIETAFKDIMRTLDYL